MLFANRINSPTFVWLQRAAWMAVLVAPFVFIERLDHFADQRSQDASAWEIHRAYVLQSNVADASQLPTSGWQKVSLPYKLPGDDRARHNVWYRLEVDTIQETDTLWAVYISGPNGNYAVWVNDQFVAETGSIGRPLAVYTTPAMLKIPGALFHAGRNTLDVRAVRDIAWTGSPNIYVGPERVLDSAYERNHFWSVTLKQIIVICMLVMSAVMAALYWQRRCDAAFGWYALALLLWATQISIKLVSQSPFPVPHLWDNLQKIAIGGYAVCAAFFVNRLVRAKKADVERWFLYWGLFGALTLFLDPVAFGYRLPWFYERVWMPPLLLLAAYENWQLVRAARDKLNLEVQLFAIVFWWILIVGSHDAIIGVGILKSHGQHLTYVVGPVLVVFGAILLRRFKKAAEIINQVRDALAAQVAEKTAVLEKNLVRLKDLERDGALRLERERIMRDMHDGVGGQLVQALSIAMDRPELQPLEETLRNCLDELSLIIDSIEPVNGDLANVLGTLRMRMSNRLAEAGVHMRWEIADIPPVSDLGPNRVLQISRIVREAIVNALKHSQAKQITVRAKVGESGSVSGGMRTIVIEIADNGSGFVVPVRRGSGLKNMRRRAAELEGELTVDSSGVETTVRLELPLAAAGAKHLVTAAYD